MHEYMCACCKMWPLALCFLVWYEDQKVNEIMYLKWQDSLGQRIPY